MGFAAQKVEWWSYGAETGQRLFSQRECSVFEEEGVEEAEVTWSIKKRTHCETWKGRLAGLDTTQGL